MQMRKWLSENKHIKYLWIPYTVVFQSNPPSNWRTPKLTSKYGKDEALQHVQDLYCESLEKYRFYKSSIEKHQITRSTSSSITPFSHFATPMDTTTRTTMCTETPITNARM